MTLVPWTLQRPDEQKSYRISIGIWNTGSHCGRDQRPRASGAPSAPNASSALSALSSSNELV